MADEHFIPGTSRITEIESFHRYYAAAELCKGCTVLDAASGDGYGSAILAACAKQVTGVDLNKEAVEEAALKYNKENLSFVHADVAELPFADASFDRVVSFETIEHIPDQKKFLSEVRRVLKPEGVLILSSPNKTPFKERNKGENTWHIQELEASALKELLAQFFPKVNFCQQDAFYNSVITGAGCSTWYVKDIENKIIRQNELGEVQYSIVTASAAEPPVIQGSFYLDASYDPQKGYLVDDEAVINQFGLRGEFEKTWQELEDLKAKSQNVLELEKANKLLYDELQNKTWENGELKNANETLKASVARFEEESAQARKEIENKVWENGELKEKVTQLEGAVDRATEEIKNKVWENGELKEKVTQLEGAVDRASEEIKNKTWENGELKEKVTQLEGAVDRAAEEIKNKTWENGEFKKRIAEIEQMNKELIEKNKTMTRENELLAESMAETRQELEKTQATLQELSKQIEQLKNELAEAQEGVAAREEAITILRLEWLDEHAKSEYLYHEYMQLKNSLAHRLFGRWGLRQKGKNVMHRGAACAHKAFRGMLGVLPGSYSAKMAVKDKIYGRFGDLFKNVASYQEWQMHHNGLKALELESDTGLIVPADVPLTSIIIPVYNNIALTRLCLHSIYSINSISPFEVIIVDDCSTDDYESLKKDFPQVRVIRNEKNSGFLLTVNRGAKEAKGEYILILNNDTEVVTGWLDELTTALYKHPEAGMIGSSLIHLKTGTLQESGNLICKNGDMMPLGRGESPDHPQFTFFREVDFCSAASIILRKKVFVEEMDGFDRIYVPAYFEDPDLGLRLKKAGYKNYVCPMSRVLHQEMASYGDALNEKCAKNRGVFMNRWREYLEENALYRDRSEPNECMKFTKPRIMYIDAETPMADRGSGGMDAIFFMEYMIKRGYDVVFHGEYTPGYTPKYTTILLRMGVECVYEPQRKIWEYLASSGWTFSYIFVSRIYQARCFDRLLKQYCPQAAYIFDTVDVHFVREELEAELKNDDSLRKLAADTKKYELAAAEAADATIVISSDEKKLLENEYKLTNVYHIPQARELFGLAPNPNRRGAVFIGSAHPPNLDGLRHFHDDILPLLPADFKLTIIGEALKMMIGKQDEYKDLLKCPQFNFVGFVQDLGTELNNALITIAPLRYGAGTKGKVASSMAYGVPCVSSAFGTEGTGMVHGENIMIAKTPEEFADFIKQLFNDQELWKKISDGGIKFIHDNYAPETVEKMMDALFADVDKRRQEKRSNWAATPVMPKVDEV